MRAATKSLPRLDKDKKIRRRLLPHCRLKPGEIWIDPEGRHRVGCLDAACAADISRLMDGNKATLAVHDPPYNAIAFETRSVTEYIDWCRAWIIHTMGVLKEISSLYVWLGADQNNDFQPLPDFMIMMREFAELRPRSFISLRNQRGYGTQKNWMAVRQELLYYIKGRPVFNVQYTDIPKTLKGYYKRVNGRMTENLERGKAATIRPGNIWADIQQVFYRLEENVPGCFAQKPLKAIDRIVSASSQKNDLVVDFFAHAGTTLLSCERLGRCCFTIDIDPIFCELSVRRLERYRQTGLTGWQNRNPFGE